MSNEGDPRKRSEAKSQGIETPEWNSPSVNRDHARKKKTAHRVVRYKDMSSSIATPYVYQTVVSRTLTGKIELTIISGFLCLNVPKMMSSQQRRKDL